MTFRRVPFQRVVVFAFLAAIAAPGAAWAGFDCFDLPEYARAAGTLQGLSTCDMTVEQARRVVAAHDGIVYAPASPARHRRHRVRPPQP